MIDQKLKVRPQPDWNDPPFPIRYRSVLDRAGKRLKIGIDNVQIQRAAAENLCDLDMDRTDCVVNDGVPDVMVTPGEGLVDFEKVLAGLVEGGFKGPLYVECVAGKELDEINKNVKSTLKFLNDILAKL